MIGGAKGIGIGLDFGIGNIKRPTKRDTLDPAIKEALCGVWIADQNTNESPTRNIIKNKISGKGGDFEILNAAYKGNSGYGKYEEDFTSWVSSRGDLSLSPYKFTVINAANPQANNYIIWRSGSATISVPAFTVKITGVKPNINLNYVSVKDGLIVRTPIYSDGIYNLPNSEASGAIGFNVKNGKDPNLIGLTIEQIPDYQGAFCTDGVDDLIVSQKPVSEMLGGSNEVTVVSMIHQIELNSTHSKGFTNYIENIDSVTSYVRTQSNVAGKTGIYGYTYNNATQLLINNILGDKNDYEKSLANATNILSNSKFSVAGGINNTNTFSSVAWYWTLIAKRVLTTDEINQVIAYYNLDRYVAPDVYYDVKKQGLTNDNHTEFGDKLIDYSGNGRDMQLYNFGWMLDSGIGKYEEYFPLWGKTSTLQIKGHKITINNISDFNAENWILWKFNITSNAFKVNIKGLPKNYNLIYEYKTEGDIYTTQFIIEKDGIYNLPASISVDDGYGFRVRVNDKSELVNYIGLTIEQIPSFDGALVFNGVNDYGQYVGDLGLKDYTVVADRAYAKVLTIQVPIVSNINKGIDTPFIFEYNTLLSSTKSCSYGVNTTIDKEVNANKEISYQSTYVYNGIPISRGTSTNTGNGLTFGRYGEDAQYTKLCLYNFMLFPYSLSEFLIERQLKKRKLGTLYPNMVEFRPVVKSNSEYSRVNFFYRSVEYPNVGSITAIVGNYYPTDGTLLIKVFPNNIDEVSNILVNGKLYPITYNASDKSYQSLIPIAELKSPQKINIHIDEYIRYEDIGQPYPALFSFYETENPDKVLTWGSKLRVGSTIKVKSITHLLGELYNITKYVYNDKSLSYIELMSKEFVVKNNLSFKTGVTYILNNEPKCILSPKRLIIPNSSYKILGYIPDISGHGNHGKLNNSAYAEGSGVNKDGSYSLDGVDDFISIPTLSSGGKQVLMKVNQSNVDSCLYTQVSEGIAQDRMTTSLPTSLAYQGKYEITNWDKVYIDGIENNNITNEQLYDITHIITAISRSSVKTVSPIIGALRANNTLITFAKMSLYDFMFFDDIDNDETIMKLNEAVGIENNIHGGGVAVDFTTWKIVRNPVLEVTPTSIHVTNIKEGNFFMEVQSMDLVIPSWKIRVTGVAKGRGVSYHYCKADGTFNQLWCEADGEYTLPESVHSQSQQYSGFRTNFTGDCDILIEQINN